MNSCWNGRNTTLETDSNPGCEKCLICLIKTIFLGCVKGSRLSTETSNAIYSRWRPIQGWNLDQQINIPSLSKKNMSTRETLFIFRRPVPGKKKLSN